MSASSLLGGLGWPELVLMVGVVLMMVAVRRLADLMRHGAPPPA